jgi:hypothetical protein
MQIKHYKQDMLTLSRIFGHKVDRLVMATMTIESRIYIVMIDGPITHDLLYLYEQMRNIFTLATCRHK